MDIECEVAIFDQQEGFLTAKTEKRKWEKVVKQIGEKI